MGKGINAGFALVVFDAEPLKPDSAGIHVWLRARSQDRWFRQLVCFP